MKRKRLFQFKGILRFLLFLVVGLSLILSQEFVRHTTAQQPIIKTNNFTEVNRTFLNQTQPSLQTLLEEGIKAYQSEQFMNAQALWEQAVKSPEIDPLTEALTWNYLSLVWQQLGDLEQANAAIAKSLKLLETLQDRENPVPQLQVKARSQMTFARLLLIQGHPEDAFEHFKQAEEIYTKLFDNNGIIGSQINQAQALQASGHYRRTLQILTKLKQNLDAQPDQLIKTTGLLSLANTLQVVGDLEQSWCILQESLTVAERLPSSQLIGDIYLSLGNTARAFGKRTQDLQDAGKKLPLTISKDCEQKLTLDQLPKEDTALGFYRQAETWYKKVATTESSRLTTDLQAQLNYFNVLLNILSTEEWKENWSRSLSEAEQLWPIIRQKISTLSPNRQEIYAQINLAKNLTLLKQKVQLLNSSSEDISELEIEQQLQQAIEQAKRLQDVRAEAYSLGNLGWFYEQIKDWTKAETMTQQALILSQEIQAPDLTYQWFWQMGRLSKAQNDLEGAIENYRNAVVLLRDVRKSLNGINLDLQDINSDIQFYFRDNVEPVYRELVDLLLQAPESTESELQEVTQMIEELQVAEIENFLRCNLEDAQLLEINQIPAQYPNVAVIYPIILPDRLEVILSLADRPLQRYAIPNTPKSTVESTLKGLRKELEEQKFSPTGKELSKQVYQWIISPLEEQLRLNQTPNQTLVFVLDGRLRNVPMAALMDEQKHYLIEKYSIAVAPALKLSDAPPKRQLRTLIAGLAEDPDYKPFRALKHVPQEVANIKDSVKVSNVLLDEAFTSKALEAEIIRSVPYTVIHIATHGQFSSNPQQTFILTTPKERTAERSNVMNISEVGRVLRQRRQSLPEPIELLVFSACETAVGDNRAVLGIAGVSVQAGVRSTIAGLWNIEDGTTAQFMGKLYQELAKNANITKAEALRGAQIDFIKDQDDPFYWAAYILVGDWR